MTHDPANPPEYPGQPESGAVFNPQSAYPVGDSTPPTPEQPPANPYQATQPGYPPPYPTPQGYPQPVGMPVGLPVHPSATNALALGLVALVGATFTCGLTLLVSPFAWAMGVKGRREVRESGGRYGGEGQATAGMVMGIVGCVLILAAIAAAAFLGILIASTGDFSDF